MPPFTRPATQGTTVSLPRILCLHGGGVNSTIFTLQLRSFLAHPTLTSRFRFVFADAPFPCAEAVGVHPVYSDLGPYRRWFRWLGHHESVDAGTAREGVWRSLREAMEGGDQEGEWVGVLGFSQGAKVVGSLLYEMQFGEGLGMGVTRGAGKGWDGGDDGWRPPTTWKFGVILAGRAPLAALSEMGESLPWLQSCAGLPEDIDLDCILDRPEMRLAVPTIHVHGRNDEGLDLHRKLMDRYCAPGTTWLVEWDGTHRLPFMKKDVNRVVDAIVEVADEYGVPRGLGAEGDQGGTTMMG